MFTRRWGVAYGPWWMVQYAFDRTLSLGVHVDPCTRVAEAGPYGPYLDLHLGPFGLSLGRHPARAWNHSLMRPELAHADRPEGR
ncbi:MAG: hypothetical protein C0498_01365 [Anaerolinea sp.]|nr:hypothetical protein [Anaerolinea sp.]